MRFSKIEDLKQLKTDEELMIKCNEIIDSLKEKFTKNEIFKILTILYDSFRDMCKEQGIAFLEVIEPLKKGED